MKHNYFSKFCRHLLFCSFFIVGCCLSISLTSCTHEDDEPQTIINQDDKEDNKDNKKDDPNSGGDKPNNGDNTDTSSGDPEDYGGDNTTDFVVTGGAAHIGYTQAKLHGWINIAKLGYTGIVYGTNKNKDDLQNNGKYAYMGSQFDLGTNNRRYTVNLSDLRPGTTYYYYAFTGDYTASEVLSFTTKSIGDLSVDVTVNDITMNSASFNLIYNSNAFDMMCDEDPKATIGVLFSESKQALESALSDVLSYSSHENSYHNEDGYYSTVYGDFAYDLEKNTTYYYVAYIKALGHENTSVVKSFKTLNYSDVYHLQAVDLGLSVKWASANIYAKSPEDVGRLCDVDNNDLVKDARDNKHWTEPDEKHFDELINNCTMVWTKVNNVEGCKFIAKNGNSIFLPVSKNGKAVYWYDSVKGVCRWITFEKNYDNTVSYKYDYHYVGFFDEPYTGGDNAIRLVYDENVNMYYSR